MFVALYVIGLVVCSAFCSPLNADQIQLAKQRNQEIEAKSLNGLNSIQSFASLDFQPQPYEKIKGFKDQPVPKMTKKMDARLWFQAYEKLLPPQADRQKVLSYYLDDDVAACNVHLLTKSYMDIKRNWASC